MTRANLGFSNVGPRQLDGSVSPQMKTLKAWVVMLT